MTAYIISYSIILFLITAVTIVTCVLLLRSKKSKPTTTVQELKGLMPEVFDRNKKVALVMLDFETKAPVFITPNIDKFLGVTHEEMAGDIALYKTNIDKTVARDFEYGLENYDGEGIYSFDFNGVEGKHVAVQCYAAEYEGKKYLAFTLVDDTDQKTTLDIMQKELNSALLQAAAKSSFLSNMSHEIRTPMNGVMGMLKLARMNIKDKKKVENYLERAGDLSVFLLSMINDILDISKIESGKMQLFNSQFDVMEFADKIYNMFNSTVTGKGITFNVETVDFSVRYLMGDELRLTQVVTNFVSNASKFTPAGGRIDVTFKQLDLIGGNIQLLMRVRDTGKGIAPENIQKIMRPFEQEEASTAHNYGGTGLGLAICDNIVRMMGGNIVVDSTLGKGSDFSVFLSLPVAEVEQDLSKPVEYAKKKQPQDFTFDGCRILLAEDNEVNAEITIEILESEGAKVTHVVDGREAVEVFTNNPAHSFDLILMDIQMPRLNGRDATREIRSGGKEDALTVPIIALSADAFVEDVKKSEEAGMDAHVSKPIDFDALRKQSGDVIAHKKSGGGKNKGFFSTVHLPK
ncbi:MAG: response regulator [Clostridiales bacterium]|nr:response regulator [Clostridiales bacterium]